MSDWKRKESPIRDKSYAFALAIVKLSRVLQTESKEFVLSRQLLKSGTSIGAQIREAEHAQSRADFIHKMSIALKEANESEYWVDILHDSGCINESFYKSHHDQVSEIIRILTSIVKSTKGNRDS